MCGLGEGGEEGERSGMGPEQRVQHLGTGLFEMAWQVHRVGLRECGGRRRQREARAGRPSILPWAVGRAARVEPAHARRGGEASTLQPER